MSDQSWKRAGLLKSGSGSGSGLSSKKFLGRFRVRMQNFFTVGLLRVGFMHFQVVRGI